MQPRIILPILTAFTASLTLLAFFTASSAALATPSAKTVEKSDDQDAKRFAAGYELVQQKRYNEAKKIFLIALEQKEDDADLLDMLAYTQRMTGEPERAIKNYRRAIRIRPDFHDARKRLADAYVESALREYGHLLRNVNVTSKQRDQIRALLAAAVKKIDSGKVVLVPPDKAKKSRGNKKKSNKKKAGKSPE